MKRSKNLEEVAAQFQTYQEALAALKQNPVDSQANLVAGKFLCIYKDDWENGLNYLALAEAIGP